MDGITKDIEKRIREKALKDSELCRTLIEDQDALSLMLELCEEKIPLLVLDPVELLLEASISEFIDILENGEAEDGESIEDDYDVDLKNMEVE